MKITNTQIKWFEKEQKQFGTRVAVYNLLWLQAAGLLKDIGCIRIKTVGPKKREIVQE